MWITLAIWVISLSLVGLILDDRNQELAKVKTKSAERALLVISPLFLLYLFIGLFIIPIMVSFLNILEWIINFIVGWFE